MVALNIRGLDEQVRDALKRRAVRHGRSMEAEIRAILTAAAAEPVPDVSPFVELMERFGALGGVDLDIPARVDRAGAVDFS